MTTQDHPGTPTQSLIVLSDECPGSIRNSPHREEIVNRVLSNWSPARIARAVEREHGVLVPIGDIAALRELIPAERRLQESTLAKRLKHIDVQIDELQEMQRGLVLLRDRLDDALQLEELTEKSVQAEGRGKKKETIVEHRLVLLLDQLRKYRLMRHDTGDLETAMIEIEAKAKLPANLAELLRRPPAIEGEFKEIDEP